MMIVDREIGRIDIVLNDDSPVTMTIDLKNGDVATSMTGMITDRTPGRTETMATNHIGDATIKMATPLLVTIVVGETAPKA